MDITFITTIIAIIILKSTITVIYNKAINLDIKVLQGFIAISAIAQPK